MFDRRTALELQDVSASLTKLHSVSVHGNEVCIQKGTWSNRPPLEISQQNVNPSKEISDF